MKTYEISSYDILSRAETAWQEARGQTLALLDHLSETQLVIPFPRPVFNSFGKHFQELGVIEWAYIDAIQTGKMDFSKMSVVPNDELSTSRDLLHDFLLEKDSQLKTVLKTVGNPYKIIDWGMNDANPVLPEHIYWLVQHEALHMGQLIAYCYLLNISIPKVIAKAWAFPPNEPQHLKEWMVNWQNHIHF